MKCSTITLTGLILLAVLATTAQADVTIETMPVGNLGNAADTQIMSDDTSGYGAVDYAFNIGIYEVTAGQYCDFLNSVAKTDTHGLYNANMFSNSFGCKIRRTGAPDNFQYLVDANGDGVEDADWVNRPVNYVSWLDAARFCNWLHNGQPTGTQDLTTTEDGAYCFNGPYLEVVNREADWKWSIPSEDEWYKAAYHKNDGNTDNYFDYPTSSDSVPSNDLITSDPGNNANFRIRNEDYTYDYTIGSPYYCTEVGEFENSESPYGTFDQGGNLWEWTEGVSNLNSRRIVRGGDYNHHYTTLAAAGRYFAYEPTNEDHQIGFRVASVPEPSTIILLLCGLASLICLRRRK